MNTLKKYIFSLAIIAIQFSLNAQKNAKIYGSVVDASKKPLIGASVYLRETLAGSATNFNGYFELNNISKGEYNLYVSLLGFKTDSLKIEITGSDQEVNFQLLETVMELNAVEVIAERITERTSVSNIAMTPAVLKTNQGLTEDPIRTMATMPGIGSGGDLFSPSQIYVRGGAPDENLFLMDNNKIYFPYYFGGQKSIFNTDAVESIELLTGGFSAAYGNHMSSVLNVQSRDGNFNQYSGNLSVGFYNSAAIFEGPVVKDKVAALVAVRRTYLDLFLDESASFPVVSFGDITYKISYLLNEKNKLSLSGLSSNESIDFIAQDQQDGLPNKLITRGKNHFQSIQLKSSLHGKSYNKLSVTNTLNQNTSEIGSTFFLNIDAWQLGVRDDLTHYLSNRHKIKTGIEWQFGRLDFQGNFPLDPLKTDPNDTSLVMREIDISAKGEVIRSAYLLYEGNPLSRTGINAGLRLDQNPGERYTDISPRFAINYQLTQKSKFRFSTGVYNQFPDNPADTKLVSSKAFHYITGYENRISENLYGWVEIYYKDYKKLVYYNSDLEYSNDGKGYAKGVELFIRKENGTISGWISYALSKSQRLIPLLDEISDFEYDQRHIFNLVTEVHIHRNKYQLYLPAIVQIHFRYTDGRPYTPVTGAVNTGGGWMAIDGEPLSERNKDYLNLNLRLEWRFGESRKTRFTSFFEVWNLTNSKNVQSRSYQYGNEYENNVLETVNYGTPIMMGGGFKVEFGKE